MLAAQRKDLILTTLRDEGRVVAKDLAAQLDLSEDTIRRDLMELASEGKVIKVHGGALSSSFSKVDYPTNEVYSLNHKRRIAQKAISLISNGMFVLTSGGTTVLEMARMLPHPLKATFISGSIAAILEYMNHPNIEVIIIGDKISKSSKITVGSEAIAKIRQMKPDLCFLGTNAIDLKNGITDSDWEVVQLKRAMIESSQRVIGLSISEKLNTTQPIHICEATKIDTLITELPADDPVLKPYSDAGIKIL